MKPLDQEFVDKVEAVKIKIHKQDRAANTDKIVQKLDELKPTDTQRTSMDAMSAFVQMLKGDKGDKGETGDQGIQGEKGEQGEVGPQGEQGEMGLQGDQGEKGDKGDKGDPGENGEDGIDGKNGKNGSPDTAEQIAEKLKTIKQAWLELSAIKGLQQALQNMGNDFLAQAKGFVPRSLDSLYDVKIRGSITNGQSLVWDSALQKWIPGSASVGGLTPLTVTGTVDGSNQTFTVSSSPTVVYVDGIAMQATDNNGATQWTYSGGTLTLSTPAPINAIFAYA